MTPERVLRMCSCSCKNATERSVASPTRLTPRSYLTTCSECGDGRWVEAVPATIEVRPA